MITACLSVIKIAGVDYAINPPRKPLIKNHKIKISEKTSRIGLSKGKS